MSANEIAFLLRQLDLAYDHTSWHGTNLRGSLRRVSADEAAYRPHPRRHNIWELALHCAYWKYAVRRRLTGEKRGSFPLAGSNFFVRPQGRPVDRDWKNDIALLDETHRRLREAVASLAPRRLGEIGRGNKMPNREVILGIAAHDLYHAGQIQLLKRLARESG